MGDNLTILLAGLAFICAVFAIAGLLADKFDWE